MISLDPCKKKINNHLSPGPKSIKAPLTTNFPSRDPPPLHTHFSTHLSPQEPQTTPKMSSHEQDPHHHEEEDDEPAMLDPNEAAEEYADEDGDAAMDSGSDAEGNEGGEDEIMEEIALQNDSSAHFDQHKDSIFTIAQHPLLPHIVATGGSEGDDAGGIGYIFDSTPAEDATPVLPVGWASAPGERTERKGIEKIFTLEGHTD